MMANYAEIKGNNNSVIIDDSTARLYLKRSFSLSTLGESYSATPYTDLVGDNDNLIAKVNTYVITLNSDEIFSIRAKSANKNVGFTKQNISRTQSYLYCYLNKRSKSNFDANNYIVDIYGTASMATSSAYGLQIFDKTGKNVIFDSNRYYMDVSSFFNVGKQGNSDLGLWGDEYWPAYVEIGKKSISNHAVIINTLKHWIGEGNGGYVPGIPTFVPYIYTVVFEDVIKLKLWYMTTYRRDGYDFEWMNYWIGKANNKYFPNMLLGKNSGIILDTTNIT